MRVRLWKPTKAEALARAQGKTLLKALELVASEGNEDSNLCEVRRAIQMWLEQTNPYVTRSK